MKHNLALRTSGLLAMATALYHGIEGDAIVRAIDMNAAELSTIRAFTQIGTMGWMAGGVLLFAAAGMHSAKTRNWIVGVFTVLYGFPAFGAIALTGGKPSLGGMMLAGVVILALYGRVHRDKDEPAPVFA